MKAIVVTDQAAGTAGMTLVETIGNIKAVSELTERPFSDPRQPLPLTTARIKAHVRVRLSPRRQE